MMTFNLREQQKRLQARMDELRAEIAFAQKGEKPWPYRSCLMREGRGYCEKTWRISHAYTGVERS
ncbi:putative replication protein DnaC [Escherichia coli]|nr:putative replication protein DnaC [Escherichia coli]